MDEKKRYILKKDYICSMGKINEGREFNQFKGILYLDGVMVVEPYATELKKLLNDDKFINEYINRKDFINSKIII